MYYDFVNHPLLIPEFTLEGLIFAQLGREGGRHIVVKRGEGQRGGVDIINLMFPSSITSSPPAIHGLSQGKFL